ncbi:uncharacterized protein LOC100573665 [Acyrthosiphon pisum]|uniref:Uncharacterized protein n=1 Tax=Acyrthosiphon pisum TaxID=7029 RepID=A0A8R2D5I2_ACYPI|nr:uncharacterized protein LOC100573665 [Acyrthosiphon pisum]XP_029346899.1 uncharacterized protein LOC100573665 [Acyrthosiphon pisum]XP_029346900.1 uncharacterized protein LOC100573665 [Acyrthosiphon pisum]|eukprot:XP_016662437.1 PREDICTED: uncharacterized protein LOC100573665 [Acyrthosiphon pisum]
MKILIILLLSIKVAHVLELNDTTNHIINKGLICNDKQYDADKCPYEFTSTSSLSTCEDATDYQYNNTCTDSTKVNKNKMKARLKFLCIITTVALVITLTAMAFVIGLAIPVVVAIDVVVVTIDAVVVLVG